MKNILKLSLALCLMSAGVQVAPKPMLNITMMKPQNA